MLVGLLNLYNGRFRFWDTTDVHVMCTQHLKVIDVQEGKHGKSRRTVEGTAHRRQTLAAKLVVYSDVACGTVFPETSAVRK